MTHPAAASAPAWPAPHASGPVRAAVDVPGSKSLTNRYLVLAAQATEPSRLRRALVSRDTELMIGALAALGARIVEDESGDLLISPIPGLHDAPEASAGSHETSASHASGPATSDQQPIPDPIVVDCGLAGTVMRFVPPVAAALGRPVRFDGDEQAYVRPMSTLLGGMRALGVEVDSDGGDDTLPFTLNAPRGIRGGHLDIDAAASSQFVSALLLAAPSFDLGIDLRHVGASLPSRPHIDMTLEVLADAGVQVSEPEPNRWVVEPGPPRGLVVAVEPDLSNAAVFVAAALVTGGTVTVPGWPAHTTQAGDAIRRIAEAFGGTVRLGRNELTVTGPAVLRPVDLDLGAVGELTPVVAAIAACTEGTSTLRSIGHLRGHETDRLSALAAELGACGAGVVEGPDSLSITSPISRGALWHSYADHRMVMAGAVVGLRAPGLRIEDVATVGKTMPTFTTLWESMLGG